MAGVTPFSVTLRYCDYMGAVSLIPPERTLCPRKIIQSITSFLSIITLHVNTQSDVIIKIFYGWDQTWQHWVRVRERLGLGY